MEEVIYLIIALVVVILLVVLGAWLMGGKDKELAISKHSVEQAKRSQADYTELQRLSSDEVRNRVKAKMVRKK